MKYVIKNGKLSLFRDCPTCQKYYQSHPSLVSDVRLRTKKRADGSWYHTSRYGRAIHKLALREA